MQLRFFPILFAVMLAIPAGLVGFAAPADAAAPTVTQQDIVAHDGVILKATVFVPADADNDNRVPFVLMTHGWAGSRTSTLTGRVADLVGAGYGVLTWDSRGFGASQGEVELNAPEHEGRDVSTIITWLVANAPVQLENGDPRIGMSGGSYAGGIQLIAAAHDARIDVIAPEITWNDLQQSLGPNGVAKAYWISLLFGGGLATSCSAGHRASLTPSGCQTSALGRHYATIMATNEITPEIEAYLAHRSPATYMDRIQVPSLLIQGFPDTLFDVDQAAANYDGIKANGQPVKLWLYDGGHAGPGTQTNLISGTVINWFDCHLKTTPDCTNVGAEVEYYTPNGWKTATSWPPAGTTMTKHVPGIPPLAHGPFPTGSQGTTTVTLKTAGPAEDFTATGSVHIEFDGGALAPEAFLFASLHVRNAAGTMTRVSDQTQPVRVEGGQATPRVVLDLVSVNAAIQQGESLVLQITTFDMNHNNARTAGFVYVTNLDVTWKADL